MTEERNENFNLSKILENYLNKENISGALKLIQNNKFNNKLYNGGCSEEIQVLFRFLTEDVFREKIDFYTDCENLLKEVCKLANEDDVLFELLEIIETTKSDNIFTSALKGLQISVLNSKSGKTRALQWILDTVLDYIKKLEIPEFLTDKCEDEEGKLIENDDRVKRLLTIYLTLFLFLEPIIDATR